MAEVKQRLVLEEILTEKEIHHVLERSIGKNVPWKLKSSQVRPAMDGLAGFLGDHMKAVLHVETEDEEKDVNLFIKRISVENKPKAEFINENNFYRREMLMYKVLEEICDDDQDPWCVKAYLYTDAIIVMPDLTLQGYSPRNFLDALDPEHIFLTTTSIARFHAAFVNYETKKSIGLQQPYNTNQEFGHILTEAAFYDCPFLRACSKLSPNFLKTFSSKSYRNLPDLESKLTQLYIKGCDSLVEYKDTINVLLHRDLWVNNIMFKHENDVPINAVLVDYQCLRYGPPAFDLMSFLYLSTERSFRQERETDLLSHYYSTFINNLNDESKKRLEQYVYDKEDFLKWCEKARMFGMVHAIALFPYILMDPKNAQKTFDDPETYEKYLNEDRSDPVIAHAAICETYRRRNLEVTEEFVETYVLNQ